MNFSLYSCNWTPMELEFKKLLLLTMKMNESNKLNIKLTAKILINMELFATVCKVIFVTLID